MENDVDYKRDNLFHTRCLVKGTPCSLIIDSENCTNVMSVMLIKRLQIPTNTILNLTSFNGSMIVEQ